MVYEFYACLSREVRETDNAQRIGLEFEVVETSYLNCFLEGTANSRIMVSREYSEIFRRFQEFGLADERFQKVKARYLGETGFHLVTVYFENMEYARYQYENWYFIRLSDNVGELEGMIYECAYYEWDETGDPVVNGCCNLELLPQSQARQLKQLYHPYIPEESRISGSENKSRVGAVAAATVFGEVDFFYVGAALCVKIIDNAGNLAAFFDLGTKVSGNPLLAAQQPAAQNSNAAILAELGAINAGAPQTIFISHWHSDHCNALGTFKNHTGAFANANISNNTEWYVPGSRTPMFATMQAAIPPAFFHVYPLGVVQPPINVNGNAAIQVGKINLAQNHPHHQGVYVKLQLASGTDVLLPGDTTYEGIPSAVRTNGGQGYDVLQACHHGGNYYLRPANQNAAIARGYIPAAAAGAYVVYSADGVYYGHPNSFFRQHYNNQGYAAANERCLHLVAAGGDNILWFQ